MNVNSIIISMPDPIYSAGSNVLEKCIAYNKPLILTKVEFSEDISARISGSNWSPSNSFRLFRWSVPLNSSNPNYVQNNVLISSSSNQSLSSNSLNFKINLSETFPETSGYWSTESGDGWVVGYGTSPGSNIINIGSFAIYAKYYDSPVSEGVEVLLFSGWYSNNTVQSFSTTSSILGNFVSLNCMLQFVTNTMNIGSIIYEVVSGEAANIPNISSIDSLPTKSLQVSQANSFIVQASNYLSQSSLAYRDSSGVFWNFSNYYLAQDSSSPSQDKVFTTTGVFDFSSNTITSASLKSFIGSKFPLNCSLNGQLIIEIDNSQTNSSSSEIAPFISLCRTITEITTVSGNTVYTLSSPFSQSTTVSTIPVTFKLFIKNGIYF